MTVQPARIPLDLEKPSAAVPPAADAAPASATAGPLDIADLREKIGLVLRGCYDPEIPVNIVELGLIYDLGVEETGAVVVKMTLTTPACPAAGSLPPEIESKIRAVPGVTSVKVDVVWDPPWTPDRMSEEARLELGMF